mmetsp:Transcript_17584/g.27569  ORF Transcript_17584/g.27569 Transcript_17584/m.27569 type:complete len:377 (-) Transcript_17584:52-1182(-)
MSGEQRDDAVSSLTGAAHHKDASQDNLGKTSPTISGGHRPMNSSHVDITSPATKKNDKGNSTDDTTLTPGSQGEQNKTNLRRGKWTPEEEAYARAVICDFNSGYLDAPIGTTLRAYLSGKLECDPMRITKKFTKEESIGKKVFRPAPQHDAKVAKEVEIAQTKVAALYQSWKRRIETQKEETNRKSSVEASLTGGIILNSKHLLPPRTKNTSHNATPETMTLVHRTAEWLVKADEILSKISNGGRQAEETVAEMKEIKSLIDQGPTVLAAVGDVTKILKDVKSKGLPSRLHSCPDFRKISGTASATSIKRKHPLIDDELVKNYDSNPINLLASLSSRAAPVPVSNGNAKQRKRKGSEVNAEDAKAFVSFLQSVAHE